MKKKLLALSILLTCVVGTFAYAKDTETLENTVIETISAEDIGVEVVKNEDTDFKIENKNNDEETKKAKEETEIILDDEEEILVDEPETESPAPPEGKVEGYIAGVYFDPNTVDCEICGGECYTCHDAHVYAHCVSMDERGYILEEWCTVCGHGTDKVISDEEFKALGVETYVGF